MHLADNTAIFHIRQNRANMPSFVREPEPDPLREGNRKRIDFNSGNCFSNGPGFKAPEATSLADRGLYVMSSVSKTGSGAKRRLLLLPSPSLAPIWVSTSSTVSGSSI
jgi:hypothetical protein